MSLSAELKAHLEGQNLDSSDLGFLFDQTSADHLKDPDKVSSALVEVPEGLRSEALTLSDELAKTHEEFRTASQRLRALMPPDRSADALRDAADRIAPPQNERYSVAFSQLRRIGRPRNPFWADPERVVPAARAALEDYKAKGRPVPAIYPTSEPAMSVDDWALNAGRQSPRRIGSTESPVLFKNVGDFKWHIFEVDLGKEGEGVKYFRPIDTDMWGARHPRKTIAAYFLNNLLKIDTVPRAELVRVVGQATHSQAPGYLGKVGEHLGVLSDSAGEIKVFESRFPRSGDAIHVEDLSEERCADIAAFEYLVGNIDGKESNMRSNSEGRAKLFDHSHAFAVSLAPEGKGHYPFGQTLPDRYTEHFVRAINAKGIEDRIRAELGSHLTDTEKDALLFRLAVIRKDIELRGRPVITDQVAAAPAPGKIRKPSDPLKMTGDDGEDDEVTGPPEGEGAQRARQRRQGRTYGAMHPGTGPDAAVPQSLGPPLGSAAHRLEDLPVLARVPSLQPAAAGEPAPTPILGGEALDTAIARADRETKVAQVSILEEGAPAVTNLAYKTPPIVNRKLGINEDNFWPYHAANGEASTYVRPETGEVYKVFRKGWDAIGRELFWAYTLHTMKVAPEVKFVGTNFYIDRAKKGGDGREKEGPLVGYRMHSVSKDDWNFISFHAWNDVFKFEEYDDLEDLMQIRDNIRWLYGLLHANGIYQFDGVQIAVNKETNRVQFYDYGGFRIFDQKRFARAQSGQFERNGSETPLKDRELLDDPEKALKIFLERLDARVEYLTLLATGTFPDKPPTDGLPTPVETPAVRPSGVKPAIPRTGVTSRESRVTKGKPDKFLPVDQEDMDPEDAWRLQGYVFAERRGLSLRAKRSNPDGAAGLLRRSTPRNDSPSGRSPALRNFSEGGSLVGARSPRPVTGQSLGQALARLFLAGRSDLRDELQEAELTAEQKKKLIAAGKSGIALVAVAEEIVSEVNDKLSSQQVDKLTSPALGTSGSQIPARPVVPVK